MWLIYDVSDLVVLWMRRIVLMQLFRWHAVVVIATPQHPSHSMVTLVAKILMGSSAQSVWVQLPSSPYLVMCLCGPSLQLQYHRVDRR